MSTLLLAACSVSPEKEATWNVEDAIRDLQPGVKGFKDVTYVAGAKPAVCGKVLLDDPMPLSAVRYFAAPADSPYAVMINRAYYDDSVNELFVHIGCPPVPGP